MRRSPRLFVRSLPSSLFLSLLAFTALAGPARATSYVMVADADLADQAAVVAEGRIVSVAPSPAGGSPSTDYLLELDRLLKGHTAGSTIVVRVLGGMPEDGRPGLHVFGAPVYREGDRALLFLAERADGAYGILHFLLGAFHEAEVSGRRIAIRHLADAREIRRAPDGQLTTSPGVDPPRDLDRFAAWIADRGRGVRRDADYAAAVASGGLARLGDRYTLITNHGLDMRRFEFDQGGSVTFLAGQSGQDGLAGGGHDELQRALARWTGAAGTAVRYVYGGTTAEGSSLKGLDGTNLVLFNDPDKDINAPFSCSSQGGMVALAATSVWPGGGDFFKDRFYSKIAGADVITNAGIGCYLQKSNCPSLTAEAILTHELGHALGLDHSCGDDESGSCVDPVLDAAIMRAYDHLDCLGGRLGSDDLDALRALYAPPNATPCRTTASSLCLDGHYQVTLRWYNQFDRSSGTGRAIPRTPVTGFFSFGDPSNVELLVKVLTLGSAVDVFYGELTNLQFTLTVTDTRDGDVRTYRNTPGDCGGVDGPAFFAGSSSAGKAATRRAGTRRDDRAFPLLAPAAKAAGGCRPNRNTLCLLNNRFAVTVDWANPGDGTSGVGVAQGFSKVAGTFYFTDPGDLELMVKLLQFPDRIAVFYGALSDLPYTLHVTDTATGTTKSYQSTAFQLCGGLDNSAF